VEKGGGGGGSEDCQTMNLKRKKRVILGHKSASKGGKKTLGKKKTILAKVKSKFWGKRFGREGQKKKKDR